MNILSWGRVGIPIPQMPIAPYGYHYMYGSAVMGGC